MKRLSENSVIDIKNSSFSVTAAIDTASQGTDPGCDHRPGRPVRRLGAVRQGRSCQVRLQRPRNAGVRHRGDGVTPRRRRQVRAEFAYDGGGLAKGGDLTLYYDGRAVGSGRIGLTQPLIFSADETTDIGDDYGMPVSPDYAEREQVQRPDRRRPDRRRRRRPLPPDRPRRSRANRNRPPVGLAGEICRRCLARIHQRRESK